MKSAIKKNLLENSSDSIKEVFYVLFDIIIRSFTIVKSNWRPNQTQTYTLMNQYELRIFKRSPSLSFANPTTNIY